MATKVEDIITFKESLASMDRWRDATKLIHLSVVGYTKRPISPPSTSAFFITLLAYLGTLLVTINAGIFPHFLQKLLAFSTKITKILIRNTRGVF